MSAKDEMDLLLAEREIKVGTKKFIVKKISMLNAIRLTTKLSDVVKRLMEDSDSFSRAMSELSYVNEKDNRATQSIRVLGVIDLISMLGEDGVDFIKELILKSTTMEEEDVEAVSLEDSVDLIEAIYTVNEGFFTKFTKKVNEKLAALKEKIKVDETKKK